MGVRCRAGPAGRAGFGGAGRKRLVALEFSVGREGIPGPSSSESTATVLALSEGLAEAEVEPITGSTRQRGERYPVAERNFTSTNSFVNHLKHRTLDKGERMNFVITTANQQQVRPDERTALDLSVQLVLRH